MAIRARWHIVCSRLQCVFSDLTAINWRFSFKSQLIGRFIIISFITSKTLIRVRRNNRRIVTQRDSVSLQLHTRRTTISSLRLLLTSMERTSIVADCYISMLIAGMECCSYFVLFFFCCYFDVDSCAPGRHQQEHDNYLCFFFCFCCSVE